MKDLSNRKGRGATTAQEHPHLQCDRHQNGGAVLIKQRGVLQA